MAPIEIQGKLKALRARLRAFFLVDGLSRTAAVAVSVLTVAMLFDWATSPKLPVEMRWVMLLAALGGLGYVVWRRVVAPQMIRLTEDDMAIKRYVAATTREAMMQVRRELGDDAVILSSKRIGNRLEILAAASDAVQALVEASEKRPARAEAPVSNTGSSLGCAATRNGRNVIALVRFSIVNATSYAWLAGAARTIVKRPAFSRSFWGANMGSSSSPVGVTSGICNSSPSRQS